MPLVLAIDLEGINRDLLYEGLDLKTDRVIEIGAVLWDWSFGRPVEILSELIDESDRLAISKETLELTGISEELLKQYGKRGKAIESVLERLKALSTKACALMAHNAKGYDRPMLEAMHQRYGIEFPQNVWIDTLTDIEYPKRIQSRSMAFLEHSHGFINPFPHQAVADALAMLKIASGYNLERMLALAKSPMVKITAKLNPPNWKDPSEVKAFNIVKNKVAKSRFRWNPEERVWFKEVHKILLDEGLIQFDFDWSPVDKEISRSKV